MTEQFRWRFNPNVIAQYVLDRHVPVGATTVLKPNEACLVIEDGRIIGTSTQTDLVVNPEVGALGRIFGKGPAKRAFLFVLLGPHDLHFTIKGRTKDGMEVRALVGLRVEFTIQQLGRLLNLPAKGTTTLLTGALAERLQPQMTPIVVNEVMARSTLDELRSDATAASNARASHPCLDAVLTGGPRPAIRRRLDLLGRDRAGTPAQDAGGPRFAHAPQCHHGRHGAGGDGDDDPCP